MSHFRWLGGLVFVCLLLGLFLSYWHYFSFDYLKQQQEHARAIYAQSPLLTLAAFFFCYSLYASLALPGVNMIMLLSGAVFGFWTGLCLTTIASTLGAMAVFTWSRYFFRGLLQRLFGKRIAAMDQHMKKEGMYYVLLSHLVAGIPANVINMLSGLSSLDIFHFTAAVFIAQLVAAIIFNYAGSLVGEMVALGAPSPDMLALLALIGITPLIIRLIYRSNTSIPTEKPGKTG